VGRKQVPAADQARRPGHDRKKSTCGEELTKWVNGEPKHLLRGDKEHNKNQAQQQGNL
jgi:hypothetical protein